MTTPNFDPNIVGSVNIPTRKPSEAFPRPSPVLGDNENRFPDREKMKLNDSNDYNEPDSLAKFNQASVTLIVIILLIL